MCIAFSGIFVRWANTTGDVVGFFRVAIAALVMTPAVLIHRSRGRMRLPRPAIGLGLLAGLLFAIDMGLWATAINMTTVANATLLGNTAPLWVGLAAWLLLGERLGRGYWIGLVVALSGAALIIGLDAYTELQISPEDPRRLIGNLLPVISGVAYAAYQIVTQRARSQIDTLSYSWLFSLSGALILLAVTIVMGHPLTGYQPRQYAAMVGIALVSHVGGWLLLNYALGKLRASLVSVTLLAQPVLSALLAVRLLGETPTEWHIIGGVVTLVGIYLVHRSLTGG